MRKAIIMNIEVRLEGRKIYEDRKAFGLKKIVYPKAYKAEALHAAVDGASHLIEYFGSFPRLFFSATQGTSGKSRATQVSYFFVKNPVIADSSSGNGLLRMLNDADAVLPTLLVDEVQDYFGPNGNATLRSLLNSYTKGLPRYIADDKAEKGWTKQSLFYPVVMNGLINKYEIPGNFLERCIQIKLPKKLPTEIIDDWVFSDMWEELGDSLRAPFEEWSVKISRDDIKETRDYITKHLNSRGVHSRDVELFRPLCEYAYCVGDDAFDELVSIAQYYTDNPDIKLTNPEQLVKDFHDAYSEKKVSFIPSIELCAFCKENGSIWQHYRNGLIPDHLPSLLGGYGIKSTKDNMGKKRGFYANQFGEVWKRVLGLDIPDNLDGIDGFPKTAGGTSEGVPIYRNPSNLSNPSIDASAQPSSAGASTILEDDFDKRNSGSTLSQAYKEDWYSKNFPEF
jgi:Protein of unknown function (DUF3631)